MGGGGGGVRNEFGELRCKGKKEKKTIFWKFILKKCGTYYIEKVISVSLKLGN